MMRVKKGHFPKSNTDNILKLSKILRMLLLKWKMKSKIKTK